MTEVLTHSLTDAVNSAIKKLVTVEHFHAGSVVSLPVMYPSGASVTLEVALQAGRVFVSDRGGAHQEAEFLGATRYFMREAARLAQEAAIRFDGHDMFVAEAPIERLAGAMTVVATCSANAANATAFRAAERAERHARSELYDRLAAVYGPSGFEREVELVGSGSHKWRVDAQVKRSHSSAIFDSVTRSYVSVVGTAAKFHDIGRLEAPPRRIAVVTSEQDVISWIGVLAGASDAVIEMHAANDRFTTAAKLAA